MELALYITLISIFLLTLYKSLYINQFSINKIIILLLLLCVMTAAQLITNHKITYPIANWSMYSSAHPSLNYVEFVLVNKSEERFHYPFSDIVKTSPRAFMTRVGELEESFSICITQNDSVGIDCTDHPFTKLVESLVDIYTAKYHDIEIISFEVNGIHFEGNSLDKSNKRRYNYFTYYLK
jgi:hypothetical protein